MPVALGHLCASSMIAIPVERTTVLSYKAYGHMFSLFIRQVRVSYASRVKAKMGGRFTKDKVSVHCARTKILRCPHYGSIVLSHLNP